MGQACISTSNLHLDSLTVPPPSQVGGPPAPPHSLLFLRLISLQQSFCQEGFAGNAREAAPLSQRGPRRRRPLSLLWREKKRENHPSLEVAQQPELCSANRRVWEGWDSVFQTQVMERVQLERPAITMVNWVVALGGRV